MTTAKHVALTLAITLFAFLATVHAQTPRMATVNITPDSDKVRIAAIGDVSEMRIEVSDEQGEVVFQSGAITGQQLDWNMKDSHGERVAAGTYLVTVTFRNAAGKLKKRVEQVTVDEAEKAETNRALAPEAAQATVVTFGTTTAGRIPKFHNSSAITNSNITESAGKIGIGTAAPISKLHVLSAAADKPPRLQSTGTGNFAAGWDFYHGTVGKGYVGVPGTGVGSPGPGEMLVYGGTGVKTSLWAGGARSVTILPNGKVGIGTDSPLNKLHVEGGSSDGVYGSSDSRIGVYGNSTSSRGVFGFSSSGFGVYGSSSSGDGVFGISSSGYAGYFDGKAKVTGHLQVGSCTGCTISSDQHLKTNFSTINPRLVLDRLSAIPIKSWNYKSDEPTVRHIGPMAQDFRAAFNLGMDDKHIDMIDANGVTMASIQALYQMMQEKDKENEQLTHTVQQQSSQIETLARKVEQQQAQLNQVKRTIKRKRAARK